MCGKQRMLALKKDRKMRNDAKSMYDFDCFEWFRGIVQANRM